MNIICAYIKNKFKNIFWYTTKSSSKLFQQLLSVNYQRGSTFFCLFGISIINTQKQKTSTRKKQPHENIHSLNVCGRGVLFHIRWSLMVQSRYNSQYLFNVTKRRNFMYRLYSVVLGGLWKVLLLHPKRPFLEMSVHA